MTDLVTRLQEAACAAISQERPALKSPKGTEENKALVRQVIEAQNRQYWQATANNAN
jgi:hypothetical protein